MRQTLFIEEGLRAIRLDWGEPANACAGRWRCNLWVHSEVTIAYKRCATVKKMNYGAVANAIMNALQDANISLVSLHYNKRTPCRRKQAVSSKQLRLL